MDTTIEQQAAIDEALVPHAQRLRIERSNFRLLSDSKSKESTLQLVYDVLRICPFFKAFLPKASSKRIRSSSDTSVTPPTAAASPRLTASVKGKQTAKASKAKSLSALSEVAMTKAQQLKLVTKRSMQQTHISQESGSGKDGDDDEEDEGDDGEEGDGDDDDEDNDGEEGNDDDDDDQEVERDDDKDDEEEGGDNDQEYDDEYVEETRDEESFDPIPQTPEKSDDEGNREEDLGLNIGGEEGHVEEEEEEEEEEEDKLYRDVNINQGRGIQANLEVEDSHVTLTPVNPDGQQQSSSVSSQFVTSMLNPTLDVGMKSIFKTTSQMDTQTPTSVAPLHMTAPTMTPSTIATITATSQAPILPTTVSSNII
uniref:Uncharacterized protein n=1 Tax=Tanacetum cinerariifolium TaxID=118510 RepID=A0A6L2JGL0_TANCI|nr:hypothetical protein [Tanacetum cinerariifolium]